ncbi:Lactose operon repressor (plasmid) [Klebsiella pneumoniae]|nr:Lactose operon repressor [Klebsiella pneumoniae]CAH5595951.1 Lactose operon repressor [Klebsiella pneumoniae]
MRFILHDANSHFLIVQFFLIFNAEKIAALQVGYDDTEDSSCYIPPLTTIKQDFRLLGKTSVDRLLKLSQGQAVKSNQLLPVSLVKRKTTLPPNTQTTSPRTLADSLMQLARQVSRLESGQ